MHPQLVFLWAGDVLTAYSDRRAIVVSHSILNYPAGDPTNTPFTTWGSTIYEALKVYPNLFLMLCGHNHAEGMRTDVYNGNTVYTLLADYQDLPNGGNGYLRILRFSPDNDTIMVQTYSPTLDSYGSSTIMGTNTTSAEFVLSYDMEDLSSGFTAYNDCVYDPTQSLVATDPNGQLVHYIAPNVTTYNIGTGSPGSSSGELIDFNTGASTGVTVTMFQSGGVIWQPDTSSDWYGGYDTAVGTDAYNTFHGIADMTGVIYYGSTGWYVDITFTGLDPAKEYTFATSASRANSTYTTRVTRYTISSVDEATNASTSDVTEINNLSVAFNTGDNHDEGLVARWTGIQPGSDGSFTVRAQADGSTNQAYSFDVFMLQEEGGIPPLPSLPIAKGNTWRYFKGTQEPPSDWNEHRLRRFGMAMRVKRFWLW